MQPTPPTRRAVVEAIVASTVGTTIEWYDFFLYGTAAALVFPQIFFPKADPFVGQILAFSTFSIGFIARPIGGVIFGYMGDRIGRKSALVSTLLLMGISTVAIGFLPTYDEIGIAAPIILTALRFMQGLGVGGEWGGAVLMALEYGQRGKRGFATSWPQAGVPLGLLASTGVIVLCQHYLSAEQFLAWGWRIPFFLSVLLIGVGMLIRLRIEETPQFQNLKDRGELARTPVRDTIRRYWREILLAAGMRVAENASFYIFVTWIIGYGKNTLHVDEGVMLRAVSLAAAFEFFTMPFYGWLSDRWSRRGMYMLGCVFLFFFAVPFFALLETRRTDCIILAIVVAVNGSHSVLYAVQAAIIPELFGTRLRCTGASIGYQLGSVFAGGLAPLIAASLTRAFPEYFWVVGAYLMLLAVISLTCVYHLAENSRGDLED